MSPFLTGTLNLHLNVMDSLTIIRDANLVDPVYPCRGASSAENESAPPLQDGVPDRSDAHCQPTRCIPFHRDDAVFRRHMLKVFQMLEYYPLVRSMLDLFKIDRMDRAQLSRLVSSIQFDHGCQALKQRNTTDAARGSK